MAVQGDLESNHSNTTPDSSRPQAAVSDMNSDDRIVASEEPMALETKGEKSYDTPGRGDAGGNMFRNIWHEYVFIFIVTSAQLITVSFHSCTDI